MPGFADLACIYLAAGEGRRFGGGKLEAELNGKMLGLHAAETLAAAGFGKLVAVGNATHAGLNDALTSLGFELVINPDPTKGQSSSLALGIGQIADTEISGALIALADMPYISAEHLRRLAEAFGRQRLVCSSNGAARMPPAIFPRSMFAKLRGLTGDQGARKLLSDAIVVEADPAMLADIDRPEDLPF